MKATEIAVLRSHKAILQEALRLKLPSVFIIEDDVDFVPNFLHELGQCMLELPEDWDALHLGGDSVIGGLEYYSPRLHKSLASWGGYGYIVNAKAIPLLIETISQEKLTVDTYYARLMPSLKWFKTRELLVKHLAGFSIIQQKYVDYKHLY